MPVTIEDKIELFNKLLFDGIDKQSSKKKEQLYERFKKEKKKFEAEAEIRIKEISADALKKAEKDKIKLISKVKAQENQRVLEKKRQITDAMVANLKNKALEFTNSEVYKEYLAKNVKEVLKVLDETDTIHFYFTQKDLASLGEFIDNTVSAIIDGRKYFVEKVPDLIIGGFLAKDMKNSIQVDYTLKALVEENRDLIYRSIYKKLDEVTSL